MLVTIFISLIFVCVNIMIMKKKHSYWSKTGVKGPTPLPFVGNFGRLMMQKQTISQLAQTYYKEFPVERAVGLYCGFMPVLLLRDPELINQVMTADFNNFVNRGLRTADEGFSNNIFISEDASWRLMRKKMSCAFTSTKLKRMIPLIQECVNKLTRKLMEDAQIQPNINIKDLASKYSLDLVCSCAFGLSLDYDAKLIKEFNKMGQKIITPPAYFRLWYVAEMLVPGIQRKLPLVDPARHVRRFFLQLVEYILKERETTKAKRHDFMDIMIKLYEDDKSSNIIHSDMRLDVNFIASQAFALYTAGFDTSSSTLSLLLYELSINEDCQETAYKEICTVLNKYEGEITYDSISEMGYLQKIFNETLRKHSVVGFLLRKASKDYKFRDTDIIIKAGTLVLVSPSGLQHDSQYYDDPNKFDPERCSPENLKKLPPGAYLPFGLGPRNCVGLRFAWLHIMIAVVGVLRKFQISPSTRNNKRKGVEFDSVSITMTPVDGIWIKLTKRNKVVVNMNSGFDDDNTRYQAVIHS